MTIDERLEPEEAPERSPKAGVGAPSGVDGNGPKRFSVQRKMAIVARLLRGEPLDLVARQTNVSIARLTEWRDRALAHEGRRSFDTQAFDLVLEVTGRATPGAIDPKHRCTPWRTGSSAAKRLAERAA